jgi:endonuclease YncB( thermonuclease family)
MSHNAVLTIHNCVYTQPESVRSRLDGDTFRCQGNVEPIVPDSELWIAKVRVIRINAPETGTAGAEEARTALISWLINKPFDLLCYARDKYGRMLADADAGNGLLSDFMLKNNLVVPMSIAKAKDLAPQVSDHMLASIAHFKEVV